MAVITINELNPNYGNRLQNIAVNWLFQDLGFSVDNMCFLKSKKQLFVLKLKYILQRITNYRLTANEEAWKFDVPKILRFERFNKHYLPNIYVNSTLKLDEKYDYFAVGSDQVWNPEWYYNDISKEMYLLTFTTPSKKICIAPCFGNDSININWYKFFAENLEKFDFLAVRDHQSQKLIKELCGKDAKLMIDPTLLFDKGRWEKFSVRPARFDDNSNYMFIYILGELTNEIEECIEKIKKKHGFKVINITEKKDASIYSSDPREFVYWIAHSSIVITDSYHASIFSILFDKPFIVARRSGQEQRMFGRIESLLETLKIEDRYIQNVNYDDALKHDYDLCWNIIKDEKQKVYNYVNQSVQTKEGRAKDNTARKNGFTNS